MGSWVAILNRFMSWKYKLQIVVYNIVNNTIYKVYMALYSLIYKICMPLYSA